MNVVEVWDLVTSFFLDCAERRGSIMFKQYRWHLNADYDGARETDKKKNTK